MSDMGGKARMLTIRSGGWVLLLAAVLTLGAAAWQVLPVLLSPRSRAIGDGKKVASYRFDLATCLVAPGRIAASGLPKDGLPALTRPRVASASEAESAPAGRGRYLVGGDRVVGVAVGGEARAYPLRVLAWHEVVNDVIGGIPVAVTYNPLSEGVAVLDRRVAGEVLDLGVSGLLYNSTLLMYDRRAGGSGESLWSQLEARAVTGPAAALRRTLAVLPCSVTRWNDWRGAFPHTTVMTPDDATAEKYQREPYGTYFNSDRFVVPVHPLPPPGGLPLKARILAVPSAAGGWQVIPLDTDRPPTPPVVMVRAGSAELRIDYTVRPASVRLVSPTTEPLPVFYAFWFAWYSTHVGSDITGVTGLRDKSK
jgi:hypothetical protein